MKRFAVLATILAIFCLVLASSTVSATWLSYRDDIAVNAGTLDLNLESVNVTTNSSNVNITLPCTLSSLNQTLTVYSIQNINASNTTFNFTVNGVAVNESSVVNWTMGNYSNITMAMVIEAGVDQNDTYIHAVFDANCSTVIIGTIVADDASFTSDWLSSNVVVREKDVTTPYVGPTSDSSWWVVNNSIAISNELAFNMSDVNLTFTYPSHTISEPVAYYNFGALENDNSETTYVDYQKHGPYVYKVTDRSSGNSYAVDVHISSQELLTACVDYTLNIDDDVYNSLFDSVNYNNLVVKYNSNTVDWTRGSISIQDFTVGTAYSNNKFTYTWTTTPSGPGDTNGDDVPDEAVEPWYDAPIAGISILIWIIMIFAVIAVIITYMVYIHDKK
jgi:hypothetical protein